MYSKARAIVITGANRGIGFQLAKRLIKNPSKPKVIITSRDETRGKAAVNEILDEYPSSKEFLYYHVLDITNKDTYSPFSDWIKSTFGKIDVLVNNAGLKMDGDGLENVGYKSPLSHAEKTIATNYYATRVFTEYVLPLLASDGKIINVSSIRGLYHYQGRTLYEKLAHPDFQPKEIDEVYEIFMNAAKKQNYDEARITGHSYNISKALLNAWTYHVLKDSLKGDQQAFTMCPGWCRTDMGGDYAPKRPEEGPETIEYLIDLPYKLNKEINGKFFTEKKLVEYHFNPKEL